jgi:protein gp37
MARQSVEFQWKGFTTCSRKCPSGNGEGVMAENTAIEWTKHTFNPWWGCTKVGPGCDRCYAETFDRRVGGDHWGVGKPRRLVNDWSKPRRWNRDAAITGERPWVFCASMADVFDNEVPDEWRARLWDLVRECRNLNWQFVTKRVGNVRKMLPADWDMNFRHCGIIATVVNQGEADRDVGKLRALKPDVAWIGLSIEPQLGPIDLSPWLDSLDWIITGGESGHGARPYDPHWALSLIEQGRRAMVPVFVKQMGAKPVGLTLRDKKGGDWNEWPDSLSIRQMPRVRFPAPVLASALAAMGRA